MEMTVGTGKILEWMEKVSREVEGLRDDRALLLGAVEDIRELLTHLQSDDRVQREAIANITQRLHRVEQRL